MYDFALVVDMNRASEVRRWEADGNRMDREAKESSNALYCSCY